MEKRRRESRSFGNPPAKPPEERDISMFCSFRTYLFVFPPFCPPTPNYSPLLEVPRRRLGPSFLALVATAGNFSRNLLIGVLERRIVTFENFYSNFFCFIRLFTSLFDGVAKLSAGMLRLPENGAIVVESSIRV